MTAVTRSLLFVALVAVAALPAAPAEAKTGVTIDGSTVTLTVPIDMLDLPEDGGRIIDMATGEQHVYSDWLETRAEAIWNEAFARLPYRQCLTFRIDIQIHPVSEARMRGHHGINFDPRIPDVAVVYDKGVDHHNKDGTRAYTDSLTGDFGLIDQETFAHEVGHLLGLGDDYLRDENKNAIDGVVDGREEGTLMHDSDSATVTQPIVDRIGALVDEIHDLPECWTGTFQATSVRTYVQPEVANGGSCTDGYDGQLAFLIDEDGVLDGHGTASLVDGPDCTFPAQFLPTTEVRFTVGGEAGVEALSLELGWSENIPAGGSQPAGFVNLMVTDAGQASAAPPGPALRIPRAGECVAAGKVTVAGSVAPYDGPTEATAAFQLECGS